MKPKGNPNVSGNREGDDFPGYPQYGKEGDIYTNAQEQQNVDPEMPTQKKAPNNPDTENVGAGEFIEGSANHPGSQKPIDNEDENEDDDDEDFDDEDDDIDDEDADLTEEDRLILDQAPLDRAERMANGFAPDDEIEVPGAELDDDMEELGSEDEENNFYSVGGDRHER